MYQDFQVRFENDQLIIEASEAADTEHFRKNHLPNLSKQLELFGFPKFTCHLEKNEDLTKEEQEAFHSENQMIVQAANDETLRAMEQLEQMAPPPPVEEKPVFDFQAKKAAAKPKLDKAEVTPMIEVNTEENRLVFEGVVFDVEHKVTRTGRVLINFKMLTIRLVSLCKNGSKMKRKLRSLISSRKIHGSVFVEMSRSIISHEI